MIVQELYALQKNVGYLRPSDLRNLAKRLQVPLYRLQEVGSFFPHFRTEAPPAVEVKICRDMACHRYGACELMQQVSQLQSAQGPGQLSVEGVSCLGRCDRAPAVCVNDHHFYYSRTNEEMVQIVERSLGGELPEHDADVDHTDPSESWSIDVYDASHDYQCVRDFVAAGDSSAARDSVIEMLERAGLLGMGGAGGRTYKKWSDVRRAAGDEKFVVCNGDESEPGTFKDREIFLRAPHLVLEGMILGGLVAGAQKGYVYIRHEYLEQIAAVEQAIESARKLGACGPRIFGTDHAFELEVFVSPGGYICGEQTALIEAMESKRGQPRNRPPELQTNGLWNKPTLLNNVETFAWVPTIVLREAGQWYADQGRDNCLGKRLFSISGDVERPGVYEVPIGISLRQLVDEHAGGIRDGRKLKAVATSGPSGGFLPAQLPVEHLPPKFVSAHLPADSTHFDILDLKLDVATSRTMRVMLAAGIVVYAEPVDMVDVARNCTEFYRNESCGKCVPCRIGSQKLVEIGTRLQNHEYDQQTFEIQRELIDELASTMILTSICGLGMVASNPLSSLLKYFPEVAEAYLNMEV